MVKTIKTNSVSFFRFLDGVADAAAWNSVVSILMVIYPNNVSTVMSWTEMLFGFGYMIGKQILIISVIKV